MFHQDLSFSRNLLSRTDANDRINWALFYQNTMTYGDFDKMFKRKRCSEEEAKILCPGTPYAHNPAFRKGLFDYFVKLRGEQRRGITLSNSSIASYLINVKDEWIPVSSEQEYRKHHLKSLTMSVSLRSFNNAYRAKSLSINGEAISSYALSSGINRE